MKPNFEKKDNSIGMKPYDEKKAGGMNPNQQPGKPQQPQQGGQGKQTNTQKPWGQDQTTGRQGGTTGGTGTTGTGGFGGRK